MDTAKKFKPHTIMVWEKVAENPETIRIINLFPSAEVKFIKQQRLKVAHNISSGKALRRGKRLLMIGQTTSFVGNFDGYLGNNIFCCPYRKLVPLSNGCPYFCTYCYLAFVYRKFSPFIKININYDTMFKQIRKAIRFNERLISFNMGEMLDSLALDHITNLTTMLIPFFSYFSNSFLILLTKSCNIDNLLNLKPNKQIVVSWSLNPQYIINTYEPGTATLDERINAARKCQQHGYRIRFRIDPVIIYADWKDQYANLIQKMLIKTVPENITLGMLRLLPGHFNLAMEAYGDRAFSLWNKKFVKGASDGKLRYMHSQRVEFYRFLIDTICSINKDVSIGLCRETPQIWQIFKDLCDKQKCNCINW